MATGQLMVGLGRRQIDQLINEEEGDASFH